MKTVRDYLFELDITELVDTIFEEYGEKLYDLYYYNNPIGYNDSYIRYDDAVRELTVFEYAQAKRKELYDYIRYLQDLEINESTNLKTGVIYAFGEFEKDYFDRWQVRLLFLEDLLTDPDNCKNRSFAAVPFSEVLMFRVADNKFTQDVIYSVIARVLHVASHTGYRQENREKYLKKAKDSGGDYEPYMPINEWSRCSFFDDPTHIFHGETAESQKKLNEVWKAIYEYEMCTMKREREIILKAYGR